MTDLQKKAADIIVEAYKKQEGKAHNIDGLLGNLQDKAPLDALRYAGHILLHKGILMAIDGKSRENLCLSDKGWAYEGFDKLLEEEAKIEKLQRDQIQSVLDTNAATQNAYDAAERNYQAQKTFSNRSLLLASISTIFILISTLLQLCNKTDKELKGIKEQLQKSSLSLDSIRFSIDMKDTSRKILFEQAKRENTSQH